MAMSRNVLYLIVAVLLVFLVVVILSGRNTAPQTGFVSPTPTEGSMTVTETPTIEVSPTTEVSITPSEVSPTVVVTTTPTQ